jgi:hypothetical protein
MPPTPSNKFVMPAPVVALAAWVLPGLGYLLIGQRARGITVCVTILLLFASGLLIGGVRVVEEFDDYTSLKSVIDKPWYMGQVLAGPVALVTAKAGQRLDANRRPAFMTSHSRVNEIGTLYTAVAGMLNLLAIIDAAAGALAAIVNAMG